MQVSRTKFSSASFSSLATYRYQSIDSLVSTKSLPFSSAKYKPCMQKWPAWSKTSPTFDFHVAYTFIAAERHVQILILRSRENDPCTPWVFFCKNTAPLFNKRQTHVLNKTAYNHRLDINSDLRWIAINLTEVKLWPVKKLMSDELDSQLQPSECQKQLTQTQHSSLASLTSSFRNKETLCQPPFSSILSSRFLHEKPNSNIGHRHLAIKN